MTKIYNVGVGIDPGWTNLGLAIVKNEIGTKIIELVHSETLNPRQLGGLGPCCSRTSKILELYLHQIDRTGGMCFPLIERYVAYQGTFTSESENICMLIGALSVALRPQVGPFDMTRAIDWKSELVKMLFKQKKFNNPSTSLDKKFSVAAAKACIDNGKEFSNDHEADAICLASIGILRGN